MTEDDDYDGDSPGESSDDEVLPDVTTLLAAAVQALGGTERPGQQRMADRTHGAFESGEHLLVQAGTGTGKSLAYLVPGIRHAVETRQPVVVATATLALQAQLVDRDLPALADALEPLLPRRATFATLKGRANYACLHRIREGVPDEEGMLVPASDLGPLGAEVVRAREWAEQQALDSGLGDRDRLQPGVSDRSWAQVSVHAKECLGATRCPYGVECFAERARRVAADVDVVVTNHALLAIDAFEGLTVLPEHDSVVVDEAHELVSRVTSVITDELWPGVVERAAKRARAFVDDDLADDLIDASDALRTALGPVTAGRLDVLPPELGEAVVLVRDGAREVAAALGRKPGDEPAADVEAVRRQAKSLVDEVFSTAERIAKQSEHDVTWLEVRDRTGPFLKIAPLSVSALLREKLFGEGTVVLTSATLSLGGSFDAVAGSVGLLGEHSPPWSSVDVGSPFDYPRQGILYVARHLPAPGREGMSASTLEELAELVRAAGGRTLGLFSSRRAAETAAAELRLRFGDDLPVLCQGEDLVPALVREFAADPRASLFGTLSLWQGVDVPGDSCQLVVIDRIPFPRPDDPLLSARQRAVERSGGNGFMSVAAMHAALLLAQGAGRLIRRASDRGVVAVLDSRLATARYGSFLAASLPPMWRTTDRAVVLKALERLDQAAEG